MDLSKVSFLKRLVHITYSFLHEYTGIRECIYIYIDIGVFDNYNISIGWHFYKRPSLSSKICTLLFNLGTHTSIHSNNQTLDIVEAINIQVTFEQRYSRVRWRMLNHFLEERWGGHILCYILHYFWDWLLIFQYIN